MFTQGLAALFVLFFKHVIVNVIQWLKTWILT